MLAVSYGAKIVAIPSAWTAGNHPYLRSVPRASKGQISRKYRIAKLHKGELIPGFKCWPNGDISSAIQPVVPLRAAASGSSSSSQAIS